MSKMDGQNSFIKLRYDVAKSVGQSFCWMSDPDLKPLIKNEPFILLLSYTAYA